MTSQIILLLASLLIKSNKFGFLLFLRRNGVIVRCFTNELARKLYGVSSAKFNGSAANPFEIIPVRTSHAKILRSSTAYLVREVLLSNNNNNTFSHYEEINLSIDDARFSSEQLFVKIVFFDGHSQMIDTGALHNRREFQRCR